MAREDNAMSPDEIEAFLLEAEWVVLGVLHHDGGPQAAVVPAKVSGSLLHFAVPAGSQLEAGLISDARCCCTIDVFPSYYEIKGATVHGSAKKVDDEALADDLATRAAAHGLSSGTVFAIPLLEDSFGFDFAKLERR